MPLNIEEKSEIKNSIISISNQEFYKRKINRLLKTNKKRNNCKESAKRKYEIPLLYFENKDNYYYTEDLKLQTSIANKNIKIPDLNSLLLIESFSPGGATIVHSYEEDLVDLSAEEKKSFSDIFFKEVFSEDSNGIAKHVMGVLHNGATFMPDLLQYMSDNYPEILVKRQAMGKSEVDTLTLSNFYSQVQNSYSAGTYRCGGLSSISLAGAKSEESGGYFSDILDLIESHPLISPVMPWGSLSSISGWPRDSSNDGPILWSRPGEQVVPTDYMSKLNSGRKRNANELRSLSFVVRNSESRETLVEDRTKAHADHVGEGLHKVTTAAVGILKAVHCGEKPTQNRAVKEAVLFQASDFEYLVTRLKLDLHEPPMTQCISWIDDAKLNLLARDGVKFAKLLLRDGDVYFIPRKTVHQFKTLTAVTSIAWHVRLSQYYAKSTETHFEDEAVIEERSMHENDMEPVSNNCGDNKQVVLSSQDDILLMDNDKKSVTCKARKSINKRFKKKMKVGGSKVQMEQKNETMPTTKKRKNKIDDAFEVLEFQLDDMRFKTRVVIPKVANGK